tara:strand:- start:5589 stop:7472 length:1884 start_codon:yes stop_codon:yes gene_type:complete
MALENGGLDAQIEQRMDAYRGNPQQLQQRYGQNKELLDLLALQKLTSEKKAVAADMQLKQAQQPGTIAQQREQEALELTKQEMGGTLGQLAQNTKGTLDQKQALQQKNMGKMAQNAGKPQMGGGGGLAGLMGGGAQPQARPAAPPPQAQGLAGARMAQAQQRPPVRMAQGGIVGYAQGEGVSGQAGLNVESLEQKIARINARPELNPGQKQALIKQIMAQEPKPPEERPQRMTPIGRESSARMSGQQGLIPVGSGTSALDVMAELNPQIAPTTAPAPTAPAPTAAPVATAPAAGGITDLLDRKGQTPAPVVPTPEQTAAGFTAPQTAASANTGVMGAQGTTNADSAFLKGTQMADEYTGRAAASESYEGMKSRLAEFDTANYGPEDDFQAFLIGTGGSGSIGGAMKGGYNAMNRSKAQRRNRMMDEFKLEQDRIGADAVFSQVGLQLGTQLAADAAANERSIRSAAASLGAARIRAATADADRLVDVYRAELKAVDDAAMRDLQIAQNDAVNDSRRLTAAISVQNDIAATRSALLDDQLSSSMTLQRLEMQKAQSVDDPEALAAINQNIATETAQIAVRVEQVLDADTPSGTNLIELESIATDTIRKLMGTGGISEEEVTSVTVDGE